MLTGTAEVIEFGSRAGSWFALVLFGSMFSILGWLVAREIRRRRPSGRAHRVVGALLFAGPLFLVYVSSLGGFYEVEIGNGRLRLHYLFPGTVDLSLADVQEVYAAPAFRSRWRLHLTGTDGRRYESATWHGEPVRQAAARLQQIMGRNVL